VTLVLNRDLPENNCRSQPTAAAKQTTLFSYFNMPPARDFEVFAKLRRTSKAISTTLPPCVLSPNPNPSTVERLSLPDPPDIMLELQMAGIPAIYIEEILEKFNDCCNALRLETEATAYKSRMRSDRAFRTFKRFYMKRVESMKDSILKRFCSPCRSSSGSPKTFKKVGHVASPISQSAHLINQIYSPILDEFFRDNPYPTFQDKLSLAQKTQMTFRQIDVWVSFI